MNYLKSSLVLTGMAVLLFCTTGCTDWGEQDPEAGNQVFPSREATSTLSMKGLTDIDEAPFIVGHTGNAEIVYDNDLYTEVLHVNQGTATMANPLTALKLQTGAGIALWVKTDGANADDRIFTLAGSDGSQPIYFTTGGKLVTPTATGSVQTTTEQLLEPNTWHFLGVQINATGCTVFRDGEQVASAAYPADPFLVAALNSSPYLIIGSDNNGDLSVERITLVRNTMNASDTKRPKITKVVTLPDPVYFNNFDSSDGLTIVGAGSFTTDANDKFGRVFQNAASTTPRSNYLLLPDHILSHSAETQQMTIGFWVNATNAGPSAAYNWAPMFMAYTAAPVNGENTLPMFACQYRGVLQVNCAGWTDYTPEQNVDGVNHLYHNDTQADWLADHEWHYYTVVLDGDNAKVYFDGEVKNEWNMDGVGNTQTGLFSNGHELKYICLGGNQAWNWADNDPGFAFDDFVVYDQALDEELIKKIISDKSGGGGTIPTDIPEPYYRNTFEEATDRGLTIVGSGEWIEKTDNHGWVFSNNTSTAPRQNYLLLPEDLLAHSAETEQLTISFWVNASKCGESAEYLWAPLFMAYAQKNVPNTWPMFACQYRGVLQLNCNGWTDYVDAQNTAGVNTLYHGDNDWLADKEWHLYTVVFNGENAKVFFDGDLKNEWNSSGDNTQKGLFTNGADLKYICLGGNQAWDWADNDAGFEFDDIMCFNAALTAAQIKALYSVYQ